VIMMAATNRLESLDTALLRPGRFDRSIYIRLPNFNERVALFKVHLKQVPHTNIDLESLAGSTYGFSGADIKNLVNEAALHAVKAKRKAVDKSDFFYAMDKIKLGLEVKSAIVSEEEKLLTAYHEAGHTIVGIFSPNYNYEFNKVTIGVRDETLGVTHFESIGDNYGYSKAFIEDNIAMLLGGRLAEEMLVGKEHITTGASNDLKIATELAEKMVVDWGFSDLGNNISFAVLDNYSSDLIHQEIKKILDAAQTKARSILESKRDKLDELAKALVKKEILDRSEVMKILEVNQ
ncbi:MAG TPA: AAA family ATPase, partial [Gammaproteobacteria bacterium]|nr:AAA family ATPase [Gammaproteobacteria bacterium]